MLPMSQAHCCDYGKAKPFFAKTNFRFAHQKYFMSRITNTLRVAFSTLTRHQNPFWARFKFHFHTTTRE